MRAELVNHQTRHVLTFDLDPAPRWEIESWSPSPESMFVTTAELTLDSGTRCASSVTVLLRGYYARYDGDFGSPRQHHFTLNPQVVKGLPDWLLELIDQLLELGPEVSVDYLPRHVAG